MERDPDSTELIAKLMATDDPYLFDEAEVDDDDPEDSDYNGTPARKKPRNVKAKATGDEGRRRRKDTGQHRGRGRFWTAEEERLFEEGLTLYGRNWKRCASHVGSRDARSVASHAQKHFIKLCLQGQPLPQKVAESGHGYTLSGKLLDPISPSAKAYGFRKEIIKGLKPDQLEVVSQGIMMENLDKDISQKSQDEGIMTDVPPLHHPMASPSASVPPVKNEANIKGSNKDKGTASSKNETGVKRSLESANHSSEDPSSDIMRHVRTEYALNRPQRAVTRNRRVQMGDTSESIQLVECEEFMDVQEREGVTQPFSIDIAAEALMLMDFHAHLSEFEIIGLLAGEWDPNGRHLTIHEAMPCHRAPGSGTRTSVELDPASEVIARTEMAEKGLVGTGWYHSHPVFSATPSLKDIENQRNYQTLFRHERTKVEPFVGLIVSPYDISLPTPKSRTSGFYVLERNRGIKPFRLKFDVVDRLERYPLRVVTKCEAVLRMLKMDACRMDLASIWRSWSFLKDGKHAGGPVTKITKLKLSLMAYFKDENMGDAEALGDELVKSIEHIWEVQFEDVS